MPNSIELNDFEKIIMSFALAKGKVDYNDVSSQIDLLLKEKEDKKTSWEMFNQTIARLKRLELLDEKNRPNPVRMVALPAEFLHDGIYKAHKRIEELEKDIERLGREKSDLQSQIYTLEREKSQLTNRLDKLAPLPKRIKQELLERGVDNYLGYDLAAKLSQTTKSDLEDAIRCLRCGIATPAAMISLRAAEDVVRKYYERKFGEKSGKTGLKDILDKLTERSDVDKTLMGYLHYIRSKRNEAEHPEKIFLQEEAEEMFITVTNAIKEIYSQT
jgi:HEPN domain-containing protein